MLQNSRVNYADNLFKSHQKIYFLVKLNERINLLLQFLAQLIMLKENIKKDYMKIKDLIYRFLFMEIMNRLKNAP